MDQFLNDHKDIDKDLRSKPSLITDQKYLDHHKDLRSFLNDHPEMQRASHRILPISRIEKTDLTPEMRGQIKTAIGTQAPRTRRMETRQITTRIEIKIAIKTTRTAIGIAMQTDKIQA